MVNTQTLDQRFLFNFPELEQETTTQSIHSSVTGKSGDIGELEFDTECARLNLASFRPALTNGAIDRLLLLSNGEIKKIHVKAAVLRNNGSTRNYNCFAYQFQTKNSEKKADYYFCVGLKEDFSVAAVWWIPWSVRSSIWISINNYEYDCYLRCPFLAEESKEPLCP